MAAQVEGQTGAPADPVQDRPLAYGNVGDVETVGQGVLELRLTYGPGYRVYYAQRGNRVVLLLCGGDKSTQQSDITKAHQLAAEWHATEDDHDH